MLYPLPPAPALVTRRLHLRPLSRADLLRVHAHWSQEEVGKWLFDGEAPPVQKVDEELQMSARLFEELGLGIWGLYKPTRP